MNLNFPLNLWDVSLLLAVAATVLLVTSELLSPYNGKTTLKINKKRLRNAALATSMLFLGTVVLRIVMMVLNL